MAKGVKDLMAATGLGRDLVKSAIRTGELPGYHVNSRYTVPDEAFDDFIHGRWTPKPRPYFAQPVQPIVTMQKRNVS